MPRKRVQPVEPLFFVLTPEVADAPPHAKPATAVSLVELTGMVLASWRDRAGITQTEMARETPWAQPLLSRLEGGFIAISLEHLDRLGRLIDVGLGRKGLPPVGTAAFLSEAISLAEELRAAGHRLTWETVDRLPGPALTGSALTEWVRARTRAGSSEEA